MREAKSPVALKIVALKLLIARKRWKQRVCGEPAVALKFVRMETYVSEALICKPFRAGAVALKFSATKAGVALKNAPLSGERNEKTNY